MAFCLKGPHVYKAISKYTKHKLNKNETDIPYPGGFGLDLQFLEMDQLEQIIELILTYERTESDQDLFIALLNTMESKQKKTRNWS